jgi:hypothetical protein
LADQHRRATAQFGNGAMHPPHGKAARVWLDFRTLGQKATLGWHAGVFQYAFIHQR